MLKKKQQPAKWTDTWGKITDCRRLLPLFFLTSVLLLHAQLPLQGLPQLPLSHQLHLQLRALQLVLLLLRPRVLYGNPQQTLLGDTQARINRLDTGRKGTK